MKLAFSKMQGAGNDFVVIDAVSQHPTLTEAHIRFLADRKLGIGCDQVLLVLPPDHPEADFRYRIYNADGSEAGQCGNGARCFGAFVRQKKLTHRHRLNIQVNRGLMQIAIDRDGSVSANLGAPIFDPADVPFLAETRDDDYTIDVDGQPITLGVLSMGNPHAVLQVDHCDSAPVATLGAAIESHTAFPERVNVGFMQVERRDLIHLRVFERGVGETAACGTGACAAVVYGINRGFLDQTVTVSLPGGKLTVRWQGNRENQQEDVWLSGPSTFVFDGEVTLTQ